MHQSRRFHVNVTKMLPRLNTGFVLRVSCSKKQNLLGSDRAQPSKGKWGVGGGGGESIDK